MVDEQTRSWSEVLWFLSRCPALFYRREPQRPFPVTFAGPGLGRLLGYARSDAVGEPRFWLDRVHPEDRSRVAAELETLDERRPLTHSYRFRHRDGHYLQVSDAVELVGGTAERPRALLGCLTLGEEAAQAAAGSGAPDPGFPGLCELAPDAIIVLRGGRVAYLNQRAITELGHAATEVVGRDVTDLVHPDDRAAAAVHAAAGAPPRELRWRRRDGRQWTTEVAGGSVTFSGEAAVLWVARDIGARRELLSRLQLTDRLASVGTLAAGVAHEIGNPLFFVISMLNHGVAEVGAVLHELGPRPHAPPALDLVARLAHAQESLLETLEQADRMRQLVRDVTLVAGGETFRDELGPVAVTPCVEAALRLVADELRRRARLATALTPTPPVRASRAGLCQVLVNLLLNAVQAIPEGGAEAHEVHVATRRVGADVEIEVRDSGGGIAADHLPRIFEPFFTTKPVGVGTGLGLFISQRIVTACGGSIDVTSSPGQGSAFCVRLPAITEGEAACARPGAPRAPAW